MRRLQVGTALALLLGFLAHLGCDRVCNLCPEQQSPYVVVLHPDGSEESVATIQAAIDSADTTDVILLSDGVFRGEGNRDLICRRRPIHIQSRNGNPEACIIDCEADSSDHHSALILESYFTTCPCVLQGVTVRNAHPFALRAAEDSLRVENCCFTGNGGAIRGRRSSVVIRNCQFSGNGPYEGSAIYLSSGARATVENCDFHGNSAGNGGAISFGGVQLTIMGGRFVGNRASSVGGAIKVQGVVSAEVVDCLFEENSAGMCGGAVSAMFQAELDLLRCTFRGNDAANWGGAVDVNDATATLGFCTFVSNSAGFGGGGVVCGSGFSQWPCSPWINNCTFFANRVPADALYRGAAIVAVGYAWPKLRNTIIAFNEGNEPIGCQHDDFLDLRCCDLYGNECGDYVGSCVHGLDGWYGNIREDPRFVDPAKGDFSLQSDSPCLPVEGGCPLRGAWSAGRSTATGGMRWLRRNGPAF